MPLTPKVTSVASTITCYTKYSPPVQRTLATQQVRYPANVYSALGSSRNTSEDDTSMQFFVYAGQVLSFQKTAGHKLYMLFHPRWQPKNKMAAEKQ